MFTLCTAEANQLYTHVDEQKKSKEADELEPPVEQLYAQVDKKGNKKSEEFKVCVMESDPSMQLPAKSQQLMEELYIS